MESFREAAVEITIRNHCAERKSGKKGALCARSVHARKAEKRSRVGSTRRQPAVPVAISVLTSTLIKRCYVTATVLRARADRSVSARADFRQRAPTLNFACLRATGRRPASMARVRIASAVGNG